MISGLSAPTSGEIYLFGKSGKELVEVRSKGEVELEKVATDHGIIHNGE